MLDVLALAAAIFNILYAALLSVGLDQQAHGGQPSRSALALAFLVTTVATLYAVNRVLDDGMSAWLALAAGPPLTMVVLLACDRDAIWGNFPPSAPLRAVQRVASVAVFALPGLLAWAAS